ncbi:putative NBD/HSP70 family sugar kinase [Streptomyces sp. 840.1]|uniref:ROK family protein n=1 Tax=Streptomyces sp. 840.1 TaxID=2485152 RepID=UPI000F47E7DC|nr:ROK family protein [Streptomyces sp. 840.1]ROQ59764.1 putative NBD/HSP70 family sugar kinase [Streptomyces sp. 840.1]
MKPRAGSKALIREINEALVLDAVRVRRPVARARIAVETGLSPATVTGITARLLGAGLLAETEAGRSTGGRPARLLDLSSDGVLAAGVRLSSTEAYVVLVNMRGDVVASHQEQLTSTRPEDAADTIARAVRLTTASRASATLVGVGVAVSGVVDQQGGIVRHSGSMGWENVAFRRRLASLMDTPVVIDSYVNSVASGLLLFDGGPGGRNLVIFSVGESLGASVVVNGSIHRGFNGTAGGFAHSCVGTGSKRPCHCGAQDCLETWSSRWGIERELERRGVAPDGLAGGDDVIESAADRLGAAAANAAKMFGPEGVVMAFTPEMNIPALTARTEQVFRGHYAHSATPHPTLELTATGPFDHASGAAYTVLAQLFTASTSDAAPGDSPSAATVG